MEDIGGLEEAQARIFKLEEHNTKLQKKVEVDHPNEVQPFF